MLQNNAELIHLDDAQLKAIKKQDFINGCPDVIRASDMSEKTETIVHEKLGRYSLAKEPIYYGEIVVNLNGTRVDRPFRWTIQLNNNTYVVGSGAINHRCKDPNLSICLDRMAMVARRDIRKGEELTINYLTFEKDMSEPFQCFCDSDSSDCYDSIRGFFHLSLEQKRKLCDELEVLPYLL